MSPRLGIRSLRESYRRGEHRPHEIVAAAYGRARAFPQPVWIRLSPWPEVEAQLDRLEALGVDAPLWGIPFAIKDNFDLAGAPTTAACPGYSYTPQHTAFVVERLLAAGAILLGKTNMDQFATGLVGTRTPYGACHSVLDPRYISGGSSSGSAVAVAAGLVSFSLGTDTAGSGRVPAAFNAIVGLKPTCGLLSTSGVVPACRSLDCVSIFAADAEDAALVLQAATAFDTDDPYSRRVRTRRADPAPRHRVGLPANRSLDFFGDERAADAWNGVVRRADERPDWETMAFDLEPFLATAKLLYEGAWVAERFAAVGEFVSDHHDQVDPVVGGIIAGGRGYSAVDCFRAFYRLAALAREIEPTWERVDALLLPTAPTIYTHAEIAAEPIGRNAVLGTYTNFVNLLGLCALAFPGRTRSDGLPFGVSLIAPAGSDELLLKLAADWAQEPGAVEIAVVGAHLGGQPLNWQLTDRGARLRRTTRTAGRYSLYALPETNPPKPGLVATGNGHPAGIEVEVWEIDHLGLGRLTSAVSSPLAIGNVKLEDGSSVKGFLCEAWAIDGALDISAHGGWRQYLASLDA